jgi:hypothetical protein
MDSGSNKAKPSTVINVGGIGTPGGTPDPFADLQTKLASGRLYKISQLPTMYQTYILETAESVKPKVGGLKYTNENTEIKVENGNQINLYNKKNGSFITTIDPQGFRTGVLGDVSGKLKPEAFKGPVISKQEFLKMTIAERQQFLAGGGSYK